MGGIQVGEQEADGQSFDPEVVPGTITVTETTVLPSLHHFMVDTVTGSPGDSVTIPVRAISGDEPDMTPDN